MIFPDNAPQPTALDRSGGYAIRVFRPDGNTMTTVNVHPGDVVSWKRNGTRGCYKGTVMRLGKNCLCLRIEEWDGMTISPLRERWVRTGFHHAWRNGDDLAGWHNTPVSEPGGRATE